MPQRHQMPFNWFVPPGHVGPYQHPPYNPMWNRPMGKMGPMRPTYPNRPMAPMGQQRPAGFRQGRQGRQGGGILARLLRKAPKSNQGFPGMYPQISRGGKAGGSLLQSLTDPNAISGFLNNTQQVLQAAQQIGPMVSQYGPVIRNLPAMWKLYRGLKDANENPADDSKSQEIAINNDEPAESVQNEKTNHSVNRKIENDVPPLNETDESSERDFDNKKNDEFDIKGLSFPKLFI